MVKKCLDLGREEGRGHCFLETHTLAQTLPQLVHMSIGDCINFHKYQWLSSCVTDVIQSHIDKCASYVKVCARVFVHRRT